MALVFRSTQMETSIKACSSKEKEVVKEPIIFQMDKSIRENGIMEKSKDSVFANGLTVKFIRGTG